jgi:hypothetical protein
MDPSEANLDLWIEPTLFLRSGLFAVVFPCVTETLRLVWPSWVGAASLGGAAAPRGSAGPGDAVNPTSWSWSITFVVYSLDPTRS